MAPADAQQASGLLQVQVAYSPRPEVVDLVSLALPAASTLGDALVNSGLLERHALGDPKALVCGVWAKLRPLDHPLRDGDRVEVYRPLRVDPKEARRQRYRKTSDRKRSVRSAAAAGPGGQAPEDR
jgi:putative ubiquitin-RnfH superfamily antitoxin RatB of RatAB toxin-antitoxin module